MSQFSQIQLNKNIYDILKMMLPKQDSIEIQRDSPEKIHDWHTHKVSETLLIIKGELDFFCSEKCITSTPGDMIHLPANTRHKSVATDTGCIYAIATEIIALENE
ncbi:cupin domain-containing protein [Bartonella raoultii]|uniref:cupin domain-containing protein n=1 Tax=Bartonella raoultii TaxID=1457020 RepID=UPI001ABB8F24|nr:cupin domain-containing protein [Bartonella raoultii]